VAVAFEQGDPDRPYIAHALHDDRHPDPVNLYNYKRNVLRTPANNKLRMDDERGQEHVKLSTEHSGKSQLNLGHIVDSKKARRGAGFELRTDGQGAIRAGKGLFISADAQPKAGGPQLDMAPAIGRLKHASEQLHQLSTQATTANADPADVYAQVSLMREQLDQLRAEVALISAPQGIALTSGKHLQVAASENLMLNAGGQADLSVVKRLFMGIGQGLSVFVDKLGIKLISNQGPVTVQSQNDTLELIARHGLKITSTEDEIRITAKKRIILNADGSYLCLDRQRIEAGGEGMFIVRTPSFDYVKAANRQVFPLASLPVPNNPPLIYTMQYQIQGYEGVGFWSGTRYRIQAANGQEWRGVTDSQGLTERVRTATEQKLSLSFDLPEEEEEEEELPEGITLRIGLFFDGTGNNLSNAAAAEQCQVPKLHGIDKAEMEALAEHCAQYGYKGLGEDGFAMTPDDSYGNAPSNVVHLHELYPDHTATPLGENNEIGYVKVYIEGIGTKSAHSDSLRGLAFGRGETGVVERVRQAPALVELQWTQFVKANPFVQVRRVEIDIFGFSRGAAAARHCANEILKPGHGVFGDLLKPGQLSIVSSFNPAKDVGLNVIGLFDTVAAIASWNNPDVSDEINPDVNLYLPANCARRVIQLTARDEKRNNFSLNSVKDEHLEIELPGAHSDLGGGYLSRARERLILSLWRRVCVLPSDQVQRTTEWQAAKYEVERLRALGIADHGTLEIKAIPAMMPNHSKSDPHHRDYMVAIVVDRPVQGEFGLVSLRAMRELAVDHGVPFDVIDNQDDRFKLPLELEPIAERILGQIQARQPITLSPEQDRLLRSRYIHLSAHWNPALVFMVNKPAPRNTRIIHRHRQQRGYPQ
jgi:type VI secretion system secreted protein VgrG